MCHSIYKDAAIALGVVDDDQEIHRCLEKAKDFSSPAALRQQFSQLLLFSDVRQPAELLARYIAVMSDDYLLAANRSTAFRRLVVDFIDKLE